MVKVTFSKLFFYWILFLFLGKREKVCYHCWAEIRNRHSAQKRGQRCAYHRFRVNPSRGSLGNCFPKSNSFNRTETLILYISFNYNYSSSSNPKLQRHLSRHVRPLRATVTNLFSSSLAYTTDFAKVGNCPMVALSQRSDTQYSFETWAILSVDSCTTSPWRILDSNGLKKTIMEDSYGINV